MTLGQGLGIASLGAAIGCSVLSAITSKQQLKETVDKVVDEKLNGIDVFSTSFSDDEDEEEG